MYVCMHVCMYGVVLAEARRKSIKLENRTTVISKRRQADRASPLSRISAASIVVRVPLRCSVFSFGVPLPALS